MDACVDIFQSTLDTQGVTEPGAPLCHRVCSPKNDLQVQQFTQCMEARHNVDCTAVRSRDGIDMLNYFLQILHDRLQFSFMKPGFLSHSPKKAHSWHWSFLSAQSPSPSRFRRLPLHTSTNTRCVVSHSCSAVLTAAWQ